MTSRAGLLGRGDQLRSLSAALDPSRSEGRVILVSGAPGIGKSTLVAAATRAAGDGWVVVRTRGRQSARDLPFEAVAALAVELRRNAGEEHRDRVERLTARVTAAAAGIDPATVGRELGDVVASDGLRGFLVVDDADLLDDASVAALAVALSRSVPAGAVAILTAADPVPEPLVDLVDEEVALDRLDDGSVREIVGAEGHLAAHVIERCVELAEGNPLAARELVRSLDPDQRSGSAPLPVVIGSDGPALRGLVARLGSLPPDVVRCLAVVAADNSGRIEVVREALVVLGEEPDLVVRAEEADILRVGTGRIGFTHPLFRPLAYRQVAAPSRRRAHAALADALRRPEDAELRALQLAAAADGPDEIAAEALELVAERSLARGAISQGTRTMRRGVELSAPGPARQRRVARACRAWLDEPVSSLAAGLVASARGEDAAEVSVLRRWTSGPDAALRAAPTAPSGGPAPVADEWAWLTGRPPTADRVPDAEVGATVVEALRRGVAVDAGVAAVVPVPSADGVGGSAVAATAAARWADALVGAGALDEAVGLADAMAATSGAQGIVATRADLVRARAALEAGRPVDALATLRRRSDDDRRLPPPLAAEVDVVVARAEWLLGRDTAELRGRARDAVPTDEVLVQVELDALDGIVAAAQGRLDDAVAHLEDAALVAAHRHGPDLVSTLVRAGRTSEAAAWSRRCADLPAEPGPANAVRAARATAVVAADIDTLDRAAGRASEQGLVLASLECRIAAVDVAARAGDSAALERALRRAREEAERDGIAAWEPHLDTVAAGAEDAAVPSALRDCTPAERRVALAVASGLTNKEAAAELFVSVKTVDFHLQSIYRKLGVRSRTELTLRVRGGQDGN